MAGVSDDDLISVKGWSAGINNLSAETAMPTDELGRRTSLREADNVDLDRTGRATRRRGTTEIEAGTLIHSLWSHDHLPFGLYVESGELCVLHEDERTDRLGVMVGNRPLSYVLINDRVAWSNGVACGMLTMNLEPVAWAPEQPAGQPTIAVVQGMALHPGQYQFAVTFTDEIGRESGSTLATAIEVGDGDGVELTDLPQPLDPATRTINVYVTDADDTVLRLHTSLPGGVQQVLVGDPATGRALATQFLHPLPPGHIVRYQNGRQYVAAGREMRWSEPLRYGQWNPARNRSLFPERLDMLAPVGGGTEGAGIFVASGSRTYWLGGSKPDDYTMTIAHGYGAVAGTQVEAAGTVFGLETTADVTAWLASNGHFCIGLPGGQIVVLKQGEAAVDGADSGAAVIRQEGGLQQLIVALRAPQRQPMAVTDTAIAHVIYRQAP